MDAGCSSIDFLGQDYKKRVHRGKSSCFECIDQLDVVVQVNNNYYRMLQSVMNIYAVFTIF